MTKRKGEPAAKGSKIRKITDFAVKTHSTVSHATDGQSTSVHDTHEITSQSTSLETTAQSTSLETTAQSTSLETAAQSTSLETTAQSTSHENAQSTKVYDTGDIDIGLLNKNDKVQIEYFLKNDTFVIPHISKDKKKCIIPKTSPRTGT